MKQQRAVLARETGIKDGLDCIYGSSKSFVIIYEYKIQVNPFTLGCLLKDLNYSPFLLVSKAQ